MRRAGSLALLLGCLSAGLESCQYLPKTLDLWAKPASAEKAPEPPVRAATNATAETAFAMPVPVAATFGADRSRIAGLEADNARLKSELAAALRENAKLKRDLADTMDDNALLKDLAAKRQR